MAYCVHCGKPLQEGAAFCSACGKPVGEAEKVLSRCPVCGAEVPALSISCPACGHEFMKERGEAVDQNLEEFQKEMIRLDRRIAAKPPKEHGWGNWNIVLKTLFVMSTIFAGINLMIYEIGVLLNLFSSVKLNQPEREKADRIAAYRPKNTRKSITESMLFVQLRVRELQNEGGGKRVMYWAQQWSYLANNILDRANIIIPGGDRAIEESYQNIQEILHTIRAKERKRNLIRVMVPLVLLAALWIWIWTL